MISSFFVAVAVLLLLSCICAVQYPTIAIPQRIYEIYYPPATSSSRLSTTRESSLLTDVEEQS